MIGGTLKNAVLIFGPVAKEDAMTSEKYLLYEALTRVQRGVLSPAMEED